MTPSEMFGTLFVAVQERHLFADSKTFADAIPRRPVDAIMAAWHADETRDDAALRAFVSAHFDLPVTGEDAPCDAGMRGQALDLPDHIARLWTDLTRPPIAPVAGSSALALPRRYVVPGGRFRELYYWDSYFTMLGLTLSGRQDLVEDMIENFGSLIDRYGHIPNGTRSYYLSRSHPPFFYLMAALSQDASDDAARRRLGWMLAEHRYWMAGEDRLAPGGEAARVVMLADGSVLNRYWDDRAQPRDESWAEDVELAQTATGQSAPDLWRNLRAAAESGWDFSSRWLGDRADLATIRTTRIVPVDLNSLLYGLETAIATLSAVHGEAAQAAAYHARADARRGAVERLSWNGDAGHYADYDLDTGRVTDQPTAAMAFPLFTGIARADRASRTADALAELLAPGGLRTTMIETGQQWDAPNGWAPLQWIAVVGLEHYGHAALARDIADRWTAMVSRNLDATGYLFEKYDVATNMAGTGGEYPVATGFGWTNGVALGLLAGLYRTVSA